LILSKDIGPELSGVFALKIAKTNLKTKKTIFKHGYGIFVKKAA
jgi:hypothetical protein